MFEACLVRGSDAANTPAIGSVVGVFEAIVGAMRRHEGVVQVQGEGCRALANLAAHGALRKARVMSAWQHPRHWCSPHVCV